MMRSLSALAFCAALLAAPLLAQEVPADLRVDRVTRDSLQSLLRQARTADLPVAPLERKMREGAARGADGARIVVVVRAYLRALGDARASLGGASTPEELDAGAAALRAGASLNGLRSVRSARPTGRATVALVVLSDLLSRGIAADRAAIAVGETLRMDRNDTAVLAMRASVARGSPSLDPVRATESLDRFLDDLIRTSPTRSERAQP